MIFPHGMTLQMDTNGLFRHVSDMFYLSFGGWAPQAPTSAMAGCLVAHRAARNGALWTDEASQGATGSVSNQAFHGPISWVFHWESDRYWWVPPMFLWWTWWIQNAGYWNGWFRGIHQRKRIRARRFRPWPASPVLGIKRGWDIHSMKNSIHRHLNEKIIFLKWWNFHMGFPVRHGNILEGI